MQQYNNSKNENLELASISSRIKAFVIDDLLITLLFIALYWNSLSKSDDMMVMLAIMNEAFTQILFIKVVYQGFFVWYYGATIGKIIAKIRVIDYNHFGRVSFLTSFVRAFFRVISEMFFYIGFIFAFFNDGKQTLQDKVARTLVVNA